MPLITTGSTMICLKNKTSVLLVFFILSTSCTTSSFNVLRQSKTSAEFLVSPDRVILECERIETDDRGIVYGFMIHVLDEKTTSFTLIKTNTLSKDDCDYRIMKIEKILKNGKKIYLAGIGTYEEPRKEGKYDHTFPHFGTYKDNGRSLQFIAIKNELNQCWGGFTGEELPCPPEPFPIKK